MKYNGVDYNDAHLSNFTEAKFIEHEKHHFNDAISPEDIRHMKELYGLIQAKYKPQNAQGTTPIKDPVPPASDAKASIEATPKQEKAN